jgi:hypothetical protein
MALGMNRPLACFAASVFLLTGCAASSDYPSLARRPAEGSIGADPAICPANKDILALAEGEPGRVGGTAQPAPAIDIPPPAVKPSRDLTTRLAQLVEQAQAAHGRFGAATPQAERTISAASGAAEGSEAWSVASVALSALESARSDALVALAELDQRYAEMATADTVNQPELDAISAARDQVEAIVAEEDRVLDRLRGRLR